MYNELINSRLAMLRSAMKNEEIDYYLITTADYHNSEYVADYFKCREFFSGFSGSNGDLLVWDNGAALWTDGRYFLQAEEELEGTGIRLMKMGERGVPTVEAFLLENMLPGQRLGTDGRCIPISRGDRLADTVNKVNRKACADAENPTDSMLVWDVDLARKIWLERPLLPAEPIWFVDPALVGEDRQARIARVRGKIKEAGVDCLVLSSLDDIAWLFLMRGGDIAYNPVALSYAVVFENKVWLYLNRNCMTSDDAALLEAEGIILKPYEAIVDDLKKIKSFISVGGAVMADPERLSYALFMSLCEGTENIVLKTSPTVIMKAVKTEAEIENERHAHIKDGVAVTKFLYWLNCLREDPEFISGKRIVTEMDAADMLLSYRKEQDLFLEESFAPIIATGSHGAIIHYEADTKSNVPIEKDAFLLMDTGAQYMQGTTDITRTVVMGEASDEMKKHYTAVLCGNLELADAHFPEGTAGPNLDILARKALWKLDLDYRHGTGHGVGYLLNVHEGPQNINQKGRAGCLGTPFEHGMITSDEPGVYIPGQYGIRLENMMVCIGEGESEYGRFFGFETLTMVPFDRRSICAEDMSEYDRILLNKYHSLVYKNIAEYLTDDEREWLKAETDEI